MTRQVITVAGAASGPSASQLVTTSVVLAVVGGTAAAGWIDLTLVDVFVLLGVAVVLPLALGGGWEWGLAAAATAVSLMLPVGPFAAAVVMVWFIAGASATLRAARAVSRQQPSINEVVRVVAGAYSLVASTAFVSSRLGLSLFGVGEPIVELTAVHYTYAGSAALVLAVKALEHADGRWTRLGR